MNLELASSMVQRCNAFFQLVLLLCKRETDKNVTGAKNLVRLNYMQECLDKYIHVSVFPFFFFFSVCASVTNRLTGWTSLLSKSWNVLIHLKDKILGVVRSPCLIFYVKLKNWSQKFFPNCTPERL